LRNIVRAYTTMASGTPTYTRMYNRYEVSVTYLL
jgi:hypothetical protein